MKKLSIIILVILLCCAVLSLGACRDKKKKPDADLPEGQVRITIGNSSFIAELSDTKAAKELEKSLPLNLEMHFVNSRELFDDVDNHTFTTNAQPAGIMRAGDIMLRDNNRLVMFYATDTLSANDPLTRIGQIRNQDVTSFVNAVTQAVQSAQDNGKDIITVKISK